MKTLKFDPKLVPLILSGEKTTTWRLWDDKGLKAGDKVTFINRETGEIFATVELTKVVEKTFAELTLEDKSRHESFRSDEEMYETYSRYYGKKVDPDTSLKIIKFKII